MESVKESKPTKPSNSAWVVSGLSLLVAILCSVWTYVAWLSHSSLLDLERLQVFLTHHGDIIVSIGAFSSGLAAILLLHEIGHAAMAQNEFDGVPMWLPMPGLLIPSLGAIQKTSTPVELKRPGWHALMGPLLGVGASLACLVIGEKVLSGTPYVLQIDYSSQAVFIGLLRNLGLGFELNALQVAGWMGLLLSGLQLLPIGATDGGQILRSLMPSLHLPVSIVTLSALTLFAFSLPLEIAMTWWVWAGFSALHLLGNPVTNAPDPQGLIGRILLACIWLPLVVGLTPISGKAILEPVIPEADISRKVEL